ncbi:restriction endonuclease subunit S [Tepidiforma flava]|uniref:Restriction endonuclease subunit S n=1 Tax=Tepidiforma flava TaxID=3004094 RepID=A0ABY7M4D9_9CHLR|nr:restriction endonuclease subunit S [Tepidiforma flava]WBL35399.1 restriction endonuclease subunit S [Tepidiforma flava]
MGGEVPDGWQVWSLYDVADYINGRATRPSEVQRYGVPVIKIAELNGGISPSTDRIPVHAVAERHWVRDGDLLFAWSGSVGIFRYRGPAAALNQHIFRVVARPGIDQRFLRYLLEGQMPTFLGFAENKKTTMGHVTIRDLKATHTAVPPLSEQRAIAHILGTLDDKIELNRRMSETLEAMARALFQAWFVDFEPVRAKMEGRWRRGESLPGLPAHLYDLFPERLVDSELGEIPEGWEVGTLGRFFEVGLGGAWGDDAATTRASIAVRCLRGIDCHDLAEGRIPQVPVRWVSPKQAADRELLDGTILIEGSGSFCGRSMIWRQDYSALIGKPVIYSNFCKRLNPVCSGSQAVICWMQLRQAYRDGLLQSFRTGTAFPNFDVHSALASFIVTVPPDSIAAEFAKMFGLSQRLDLMAQSRTLAALRDALLPKLISGELRVKDAERFLERAGLT